MSPWPLASWPCSLFPEATWAQEEVLATEAGCKGTALPPDLSTNVLLEVWERWPPTLSATKPLLLYGPHPLLYLLLAYSEWPLPPLDPGEKLTSDTSVLSLLNCETGIVLSLQSCYQDDKVLHISLQT